MKCVTIKDVAKALNVSISTVSRAFNDTYDIHPDTKQQILKTAKAMGYTPNPIAKRLKTHKTNMIGVVVPEFINAFFPKVMVGIQKVMTEAGYQVLIMSSNESAQQEREILKTLEQNGVDGIIISLTQETRDVSFLKEIYDKNIPIVQFNRVSPKLVTPKVIFDDYHWAFKATEHLIEQGYKKIYHLSGPSNLVITQNRRRGFTDAMKQHHLECEHSIFETGIFIENAKEQIDKLIDEENVPEAFFCFNDPLAIGVIEEFRNHGYTVSTMPAVIGFSESRIAPHTYPSLSSVEQPCSYIGEETAKIMLNLLNGKQVPNDLVEVIDGKLNIRSSSVSNR